MLLAFLLDHPTFGRLREECVQADHLVLPRDGQPWRGRTSRTDLRTVLHLSWLNPEALQYRTGAPLPVVNGAPAQSSGWLSPGDRLTWHAWTVEVREVTFPGPEEEAMVDAARRSNDALLVYADWLEARGEEQCAEWARLSLEPTRNVERLRALAREVGVSFRARVARGPVERCGEGCGRRWEELPLGERPWQRPCAGCQRDVSWSPAADVAPRLGPVVLDPATPRTPGDLLPRLLTIG